jgi:hypothetical protein
VEAIFLKGIMKECAQKVNTNKLEVDSMRKIGTQCKAKWNFLRRKNMKEKGIKTQQD